MNFILLCLKMYLGTYFSKFYEKVLVIYIFASEILAAKVKS